MLSSTYLKAFFQRSKTLMALLVIVLSLAVVSSDAQQVTDLTREAGLEQKRTILEREERIRLLLAQGSYADVLDEVEILLSEDPENRTGILYKDVAERRLAEAGAGAGDEPVASATRLDPSQIRDTEGPQRFAERTSNELSAPAPLAPRETRGVVAGGIDLTPILIGLAVAVGIALIVFLIYWLVSRRRQAAVTPASSLSSASVYGLGGLGERPTIHGDITRQHTNVTADQGTGIADAPTMPEVSDDYVARPPRAPEPKPVVAHKPTSIPMPDPPSERDSLELSGLFTEDPKAPELGSSLGIDYSDTDSPFSSSQAGDVFQTAGHAFAGTPEETIGSPQKRPAPTPPALDPPTALEATAETIDFRNAIAAPPPVAPAPAPKKEPIAPPAAMAGPVTSINLGDIAAAPPPMADNDAATFNSLMFAGGAPAVPNAPVAANDDATFNSLMFGGNAPATPAQPPAAAASPAASEQDLTFNSLMFAGAAPQPEAPSAPKTGAEDLTFNSLMFAGAEDTKSPVAPANVDDGESTKILPGKAKTAPTPAGAASDAEATMQLPSVSATASKAAAAATSAGAAQRGSMFERQRDAGREALEAQDYAKAVQCFSVAASLKPGDKEVRELLEEARRLRRG